MFAMGAFGFSLACGSQSVTVVPIPSSLFNRIIPPDCAMNLCTIERPSPVPFFPTPLVAATWLLSVGLILLHSFPRQHLNGDTDKTILRCSDSLPVILVVTSDRQRSAFGHCISRIHGISIKANSAFGFASTSIALMSGEILV